MALDQLPELQPEAGEAQSAEVAVNDDVLVKVFALGPGASVPPHDHPTSTNVFHVLRGAPTVIRDDEEEPVEAPGVVVNERGAVHGLRNDGDDVAVVTATFSPPPG
ncbi:MAG TPA: cupin domain-containing protein [Halobacteriales archaeon]|nr:cupin domain-containing protein [Halobacteriales archaeon]